MSGAEDQTMQEGTDPVVEKPSYDELSPEAQVEQLMRDLTENPAINCRLTFNWHGHQELANRAGLKIRLYGLLMREKWPSMSFEALKAITFHHDYVKALKDAAGADRTAPTPTKEAGGFSVGMMVRVADGVHLVMHESVLDLSKLFPGCVALFAGFGLHYRPQGDGAYVDIPSTLDTSRAQAMLRRMGLK